VEGGVFHVEGAGADIWGNEDAFHYVFQPLVGDAWIQARVTSIQMTHEYAKAGIMARVALSGPSVHGFWAAHSEALTFAHRTASGADTEQTFILDQTAPAWLRLERTGQTLTAFTSEDGESWTEFASESFADLPERIYYGLAVTSHSPGVAAAGTFGGVHMSAPPSGGDAAIRDGDGDAAARDAGAADPGSSGADGRTEKRVSGGCGCSHSGAAHLPSAMVLFTMVLLTLLGVRRKPPRSRCRSSTQLG
jgi:MYXO-CTERM domain-containing protein